MKMIEFVCTRCNEKYSVPEDMVDKIDGICPSCKLELLDTFYDVFYKN